MNGKFEERLARLAFGDITPEEAQRLEQEAQGNPEAARILTEYRSMRDGLRGLGADVPADQMSKERLRDAILGQGLRPVAPEPARLSLTWLWMPTVACAIAFGIFTIRNNAPTTGEPMIVMDQTKGSAFKTDLQPPTTVASLMPTTKQEKVETPKPKVMTVAKTSSPSSRTRRPRRPIILDSADYQASLINREIQGDGNIEETKKEPAPVKEDTKTPEPVMTLASAPIVLIDTGKNADTGASTATEVGTANDVLVGG